MGVGERGGGFGRGEGPGVGVGERGGGFGRGEGPGGGGRKEGSGQGARREVRSWGVGERGGAVGRREGNDIIRNLLIFPTGKIIWEQFFHIVVKE